MHVLQGLSVDDLKGFMALDYARLAGCRSCGKKTVNLILELQRDIAWFAGAQAQRDGVFHPESLLDAPCLVGTVKGEQCDTPSDILCADVANPAPWLTAWVLDLAKTERHARVFMLRMGMMGEEPITLEAVAKRFGGLTRERIRQIQKAVAKKAEAPVQQRRLRPLVAAAAAEVARQGGWVRLPDLTAAVLGRGSGGNQLRHATALINFFAGMRVWREAGLFKPRFGLVTDSAHQFVVSDGKPTGHRKAACRKRQLALHVTLTMTDMYNVLEAVRANGTLTPKQRAIHDQGLVTVLRQLHDELDDAVAAAYGWVEEVRECESSLVLKLTDDEILERLVALNKIRAEEEARGTVRYLRPAYQHPTESATQSALGLPSSDLTAPSSGLHPSSLSLQPSEPLPWPSSLADQIALVRGVIHQTAWLPTDGAKTLARHFTGVRAPTVQRLVDALAALGHVG